MAFHDRGSVVTALLHCSAPKAGQIEVHDDCVCICSSSLEQFLKMELASFAIRSLLPVLLA